MLIRPGIEIDRDRLAEFCRRHGVRRLAAFGSVLRDDFGSDSDIDLLVEFGPAHVPGLISLAAMELELADLFRGREVELRTYADLSLHFRDDVRATAIPLYAAA